MKNPNDVLFSCVPSLIQTNNVRVNMLKKKVCDNRVDCLDHEDEDGCSSEVESYHDVNTKTGSKYGCETPYLVFFIRVILDI